MRTNTEMYSRKICREWKISEHPVLNAKSSSNPSSFLRSSLWTRDSPFPIDWLASEHLQYLPVSALSQQGGCRSAPAPAFYMLLGLHPQVLTATHQALYTSSCFSQPLFSPQSHLWSLTILFDCVSPVGCLPVPSSESSCASRYTCSVNRAKCMFSYL